MEKIILAVIFIAVLSSCGKTAPSPETRPQGKVYDDPQEKEEFLSVLGNTHSHCRYSGDAVQTDENTVERHFQLAKENGYDFYCVTDHSQYDTYTEDAWNHILEASETYTDDEFVAVRGYEHSENNGPGAKGHLNVYNSTSWLNALEEGVDMQFFHDWLSGPENSAAAVSMNHPEIDQYSDFACYNDSARDRITMFEVINGTDIYYDSYKKALSLGWKVSPVAGCDNHAVNAIGKWKPRTGLAVKELTREGIYDAMRNRRTYATSESGLKVIYYVNNHVMGSVFNTSSDELVFDVEVSIPDPGKIGRIEIVNFSDSVVASGTFDSNNVECSLSVPYRKGCYYLKIYNFTSPDPVAYTAPVWIE